MKTGLPRWLGIGLLAVVQAAPAAGGGCEARSPGHTVALLELYTSEGCSSCPPADRWLSGLAGVEPAAGRVVPLALHVDYWDDLGWKDVFAQPGFAARQRRLARQAGSTTVYTPQFFLQGEPYRPPASAAAWNADLAAVAGRPARADIALALAPVADGKLVVKVSARLREGSGDTAPALFVALYENGLSSRVQAGENRGATLSHDFVVRQWSGPRPLPGAGAAETELTFTLAPDWQQRRLGVAAFVQDAQGREVLQALARSLCG